MKYPFYTQSMPVVGSEAERLLSAVDQDRYVANDAALATAKRIAERRKARSNYQGHELADASTR
jgi:hypothetical protein